MPQFVNKYFFERNLDLRRFDKICEINFTDSQHYAQPAQQPQKPQAQAQKARNEAEAAKAEAAKAAQEAKKAANEAKQALMGGFGSMFGSKPKQTNQNQKNQNQKSGGFMGGLMKAATVEPVKKVEPPKPKVKPQDPNFPKPFTNSMNAKQRWLWAHRRIVQVPLLPHSLAYSEN